MKKLILIIIFAIEVIKLSSQQGLNYFQYGIDSAKIEAQSHNKYILLEFFADWCINCKIMEEEMFTLHELNTAIHQKCLPLHINIKYFASMDLAEEHEIKVYPTLLVLKPDGTIMKKIEGKKTYYELLQEFNNLHTLVSE